MRQHDEKLFRQVSTKEQHILKDLLLEKRTRSLRNRSHNFILPYVKTERFKQYFVWFCFNNFIGTYCPKGVGHERDSRSHARCLPASVNRPQHRHLSTLIDKCVGSFKSPDSITRDLTKGLTSLSTDGVWRKKVAQNSTLDQAGD